MSRDTKTEGNRRRAAIFCVKPLPWRGLRGLGLGLKPLIMKKGLGMMEDFLMKEGWIVGELRHRLKECGCLCVSESPRSHRHHGSTYIIELSQRPGPSFDSL